MRKLPSFYLCCIIAIAVFSVNAECKSGKDTVKRISPEQARARVLAGKALLVCSYDDNRCRDLMLEGAILKSKLEAMIPSLPKGQEIIFYCT